MKRQDIVNSMNGMLEESLKSRFSDMLNNKGGLGLDLVDQAVNSFLENYDSTIMPKAKTPENKKTARKIRDMMEAELRKARSLTEFEKIAKNISKKMAPMLKELKEDIDVDVEQLLVESHPGHYRMIVDVIDALDYIPQAKKYRIKGAEYDDVIYALPERELKKFTGLTMSDLEKIQSRQNMNEGWAMMKNGLVELSGEA